MVGCPEDPSMAHLVKEDIDLHNLKEKNFRSQISISLDSFNLLSIGPTYASLLMPFGVSTNFISSPTILCI